MATLERQIALVTGASSGIGEATAARLGWLATRCTAPADAAPRRATGSFEMLTLDVTSDASVEAFVSDVMRLDGRIDLLVNNAGFGVAPAGAEESSIEQARSIFETNFFGLVRMTRAVVPHMRRQGSGRIINIGSVLGFLPMPMARSMLQPARDRRVFGIARHELRTRGIRVSVIDPLTRRRSSIRTSWNPTRRSMSIARFVRPWQEVEGDHDGCRRTRRRGRRRAGSCRCGSPETQILSRCPRTTSPMAS